MPEYIPLGACRACGGTVSSQAVMCPHCGQPSPYTVAGDQFSEARGEMERGNKIMAIKLVREKTGLGLAEAKALVESW